MLSVKQRILLSVRCSEANHMCKHPITQQGFEARVPESIRHRSATADTINEMMQVSLQSCNVQDPSIERIHTVFAWEANVFGNMHGGLIAPVIDMTMGILCMAYTDAEMTPTTSMTVNFLKPIRIDSVLHMSAQITHCGKSILHLSAACWTQDRAKPVATAEAVFFRINQIR